MKKLFSLILILSLLSGCSAIHGAAQSGDIKTINKLLNEGEDVNKIGDYDEVLGAMALIPPFTLIAAPALLVRAASGEGNTVLYYAVKECQLEAARLLLEKGADPNRRPINDDGYTPLCMAAARCRTEFAKLLLEYGADPTLLCYEKTALQIAQKNNHPETVLLLQEGMEKQKAKKAMTELKARIAAARKTHRQVDFMKSNQEETAGDSAMAEGKPDEALAHYILALKAAPPGEKDQKLREKVVKFVLSMAQRPSIPDKAQEHSDRAQAFMKRAGGVEGYEQAIAELEAALLIAPWWPEAYFNLGLLLEKAGDYEAAIGSLKLYLLSAPDAKDAGAVKKKIIDIEVAKEMAKGR